MKLRNMMKTGLLSILLIFSCYLSATEKVLLTVHSDSESINETFTRQQLLQLPQHDVTTNLPWTEKSHTYSGPYLQDVLAQAKATGQWITLSALDYYSVYFNIERVARFNPILALKKEGELLSIRSKGPIWLILPVDSDPALNAAVYNDYMVWHLVRITVEDREPQ